MATHTTFKSFAKRMRVIASNVTGNTGRVVRRAALAADQVAVLATPVDTGRARGGWTVGIGGIGTSQQDRLDPSGDQAIAEGLDKISKWKVGSGPINISNDVVYVPRLDNGYSAQAPNGMTAQALAAANDVLRKAKLLED